MRSQRYQHHEEELDSEGSWAISYGDMVTLLLAFFLLFFSVDPQQEYRSRLEASLFTAMSKSSQVQARAPDNARELNPLLKKQWPGEIHQIGARLIVEFPGISFYNSGAVELTKEGEKALAQFVSLYMPYAGQHVLSLNAYTDPRAVSSQRRYKDNLELSALRAVAAMRTMQKAGVPLDRMVVGGYGELHQTEQDLAKISEAKGQKELFDLSRKVVLIIKPEEEKDL